MEINDSGCVVAAVAAAAGILTNLENATAPAGDSHCRLRRFAGHTFIALSWDRNLADKNEPCGDPGRQFLQLEPEKE